MKTYFFIKIICVNFLFIGCKNINNEIDIFDNIELISNDNFLFVYTYNNLENNICFEKVNLENLESKIISSKKSDGYLAFEQKNKFLIFFEYLSNPDTVITYIILNGEIIKIIDDKVFSELQSSSMFGDDILIMDYTDYSLRSEIPEEYENELFLYSQESDFENPILINLTQNTVYRTDLNINVSKYVYYTDNVLVNPDANTWALRYKIFNLIEKEIIYCDTLLKESKYENNQNDWQFVFDYSFWINENEVTYLIYRDEGDKLQFQIKSYQIDKKELKVKYEFEIPEDRKDYYFKYVIDKNEDIYLSNRNIIYRISKTGDVKKIYESPNEICGFHLE